MPGTTRDSIDTLVETPDGPIVFIDTAGMRRRSRIDDSAEYYSMVRALRGEPQPTHEFFYWEFHERGFQQAVRMGDWKAVRLSKDARLELFDLHSDPGEQHDVANSHTDVIARIEHYLETARTDSPGWPIR